MTTQEVVAFAEGLAHVAASGGGTQALVRHVAQTTSTAVNVEDVDRGQVASAGDATLARVAPGWAIPIYVGQTHLGWISIFGDSPAIETILRLAAGAIGVELAHDADGGRSRRRAFWERLSAGAYHDSGVARDEAAARGIACAATYVAIALECDAASETAVRELSELATQAFASAGADVGMVEDTGALIVLVPAVREVDASNARTAAGLLPRAGAKRNPPLSINGGVGRALPLVEVPRSVEQARAALRIGRRIGKGAHVYAYDDLGAYPLLLEGAGAQALRGFAQAALAPLRAYDEKHQTELERTLRVYFSAGQNVKLASEQLNVHRHTVFYRLRQIGEIASRSLESADDQLTLRMAIAIDAIHS
jgi:sugar diacid utilization regulator